jgi:hypothetical protein
MASPIVRIQAVVNLDKSACAGITKDKRIDDPIIVALTNSRLLKNLKPIKAPGIKIKKRTTRVALKESLKEPLSKNDVKNRDEVITPQILNLTNIWLFFSVLSTSQL